jgi:hypothetical protein
MSEESQAETGEAAEPISNVYRLEHPVKWGEKVIEELKLHPNGKALRDVKLTISDGAIVVEPYKLAELGLRLANQPRPVLDLMHPADQTGLGMLALGFIMPGLGTGLTPSR